jgi:hypothetical protein
MERIFHFTPESHHGRSEVRTNLSVEVGYKEDTYLFEILDVPLWSKLQRLGIRLRVARHFLLPRHRQQIRLHLLQRPRPNPAYPAQVVMIAKRTLRLP